MPSLCSYSRHDLPSLETAPTSSALHLMAPLSHLGIARDVLRKPHRSRRGGRNERRKIKVIVGFHDLLPSDSSSSPTPLVKLPSLTFTVSVQLPSLTLTRVNTVPVAAAPPTSLPGDLTASSLSARLRPPHRQLLHIPLGFSSARNTRLVCLCNERFVSTTRRRSDVSTFIQDNIDIMLLTETWLRPAGDDAKIAGLGPRGYFCSVLPSTPLCTVPASSSS